VIIRSNLPSVADAPLLDFPCLRINLIRLIALPFLERPELTLFHFLSHFFQPFLNLFLMLLILLAREYLFENMLALI
jgi:hypothetical protein